MGESYNIKKSIGIQIISMNSDLEKGGSLVVGGYEVKSRESTE